MAESKLIELSTDLYNRCGTIRRILVASKYCKRKFTKGKD